MPELAKWRGRKLRQQYDVQDWADVDRIIDAERIPILSVGWLCKDYGVDGLTINEVIFVDAGLEAWHRPRVIAHELYHYLYDAPALAALLWRKPDVRLVQMEARARAFAMALGAGV